MCDSISSCFSSSPAEPPKAEPTAESPPAPEEAAAPEPPAEEPAAEHVAEEAPVLEQSPARVLNTLLYAGEVSRDEM